MKLGYPSNLIELKICEVVPPSLPTAGDVLLEVTAVIGAFSGVGSCWINAKEMESFSNATHLLYSSLQGIAQLASISPEDFTFSLEPSDSSGSVLVKIKIVNYHPVLCSLTGEFIVELQALAQVIAWSKNPYLDP
jgi:hypothetical protein